MKLLLGVALICVTGCIFSPAWVARNDAKNAQLADAVSYKYGYQITTEQLNASPTPTETPTAFERGAEQAAIDWEAAHGMKP